MPQEWQAFFTPVGAATDVTWFYVNSRCFSPCSFWVVLSPDLGSSLCPRAQQYSRDALCRALELCVLLSLLCPVDSSHTASLNSEFCLLSSGRQLGSSSLFWPEYFLQASASWGNLRTASSVSLLSGITVLCSQIANVWNQVDKIHLVLYFSYCTQEGESGPCYCFVVRSSGPYPNFYSDHFLKLLCSFIIHMHISRNYRLVLPIKHYYTPFKSVLI